MDDDIEEIQVLEPVAKAALINPNDAVDSMIRSTDKCILCQVKIFSDAAWSKHVLTPGHKKKLNVYDFLMNSKEVGPSNSSRSLIQEAMTVSPSASFLLGQDCLHEVQDGGVGKEKLLFWACSVCYVSGCSLNTSVDHLGSHQHRLYYISQYHEEMKPKGTTADEVKEELLKVSKELREKNQDLTPEIMNLRPGVSCPEIMKRLEISTETAAVTKAGAAAKVIQSSGDHTLIWCDQCWATLVIDLKSSSVEAVWSKHVLTPAHLKKIDQRRKLTFKENHFILAEASLAIRRELERTKSLVGLDYVVERHRLTTDGDRERDLVCLLCSQIINFKDLQSHITNKAHLGQFLHKEHPEMILKLSKEAVANRSKVVTQFFKTHTIKAGHIRVHDPLIVNMMNRFKSHNPKISDKGLQTLQTEVFLKLLDSETGDLLRLPGDISGELHRALASASGSMLGLQYVYEVCSSGEGVFPSYVCRLCPSWESSVSITTHLKSVLHRTNYLERSGRKEELSKLNRLSDAGEKSKLLAAMADEIEKSEGRKGVKGRLKFRPSPHILERLWPNFAWRKQAKSVKNESSEKEKKEEASRKRKASPSRSGRSSSRDRDRRRSRSRSRERRNQRRSRSRSRERSHRTSSREPFDPYDVDMTAKAAPPPRYNNTPAVRPPPLMSSTQPPLQRPRLGFNSGPNHFQPPQYPPSSSNPYSAPPPTTTSASLLETLQSGATNLSKEDLIKMLLAEEEKKKREADEQAQKMAMLRRQLAQQTGQAAAVPKPQISDRLSNALKALGRAGGQAPAPAESALSGLANWASGGGAQGNPNNPSQFSSNDLDALNALLNRPPTTNAAPPPQGPGFRGYRY